MTPHSMPLQRAFAVMPLGVDVAAGAKKKSEQEVKEHLLSRPALGVPAGWQLVAPVVACR